MTQSQTLLENVIEAGQDFEWYPTTELMIDVVARHIPKHDTVTLMDVGAGDGRVLVSLANRFENRPTLYGIEKSMVLVEAQPEEVVPVGTDFYEQNLACLPADYIFCNPPYSQYEPWCSAIIESGFAKKAFLVIPQRWKDSKQIQASLSRRSASARVIHSGDFRDAERRARAVIDIVEITYPTDAGSYRGEAQDPFDAWFDQNISTFDKADDSPTEADFIKELAKTHNFETISGLVGAYDAEYAIMESNYQAIFKLDQAILRELGVSKDAVREGIKKRMAGLKAKYWQLLFERLKSITDRLATETRDKFLKRLIGPTSIAFTASNAYAVVIWAIKHANKYYDEQLVKLFKDLSTFDGVLNYKSNQRTWEKSEWRFMDQNPTHYALDYRIVVSRYNAIRPSDAHGSWDYPNNLSKRSHDIIADTVAVLGNLGFSTQSRCSLLRQWIAGTWEDFRDNDHEILFQVKGHKNGNLHFRFKPDVIRAISVEAGRLMGWLRNRADVVDQLGYSDEEATRFFKSNRTITAASVKLLN